MIVKIIISHKWKQYIVVFISMLLTKKSIIQILMNKLKCTYYKQFKNKRPTDNRYPCHVTRRESNLTRNGSVLILAGHNLINW